MRLTGDTAQALREFIAPRRSQPHFVKVRSTRNLLDLARLHMANRPSCAAARRCHRIGDHRSEPRARVGRVLARDASGAHICRAARVRRCTGLDVSHLHHSVLLFEQMVES